jgi:KRAB domain-containing zinc finger protein
MYETATTIQPKLELGLDEQGQGNVPFSDTLIFINVAATSAVSSIQSAIPQATGSLRVVMSPNVMESCLQPERLLTRMIDPLCCDQEGSPQNCITAKANALQENANPYSLLLFKFKCRYCEIMFVGKDALISHENENHFTDMKSVESEQKSVESEQKSVESEQKSVESEQKSVESELKSVESEQKSVESELKSVESEQKSVESEQQSVESDQVDYATGSYRSGEGGPLKCRQGNCEKGFLTKRALYKHECTMHATGSTMHLIEKPFVCHHCVKRFEGRPDLLIHVQIHRCACNICHDSEEELETKYPDLRRKVFLMEKRAKEQQILKHPLRYTYPMFNCDYCYKSFTTNRALIKHVLHGHPEKKPFRCNECGDKFPLSKDLHHHMMKVTHPNIYKCKRRGKSFGSNGILTIHEKLHKSVKPVKYCGRPFSNTWICRHKRKCRPEQGTCTMDSGGEGLTYDTARLGSTLQQVTKPCSVVLQHLFECQYCEKVFVEKQPLFIHENENH